MKYLALLALFLTACDLHERPIPQPHEAKVDDFDPKHIVCAEFDRHTKRNGKLWTCRIIYCRHNSTVNSGSGSSLWCEADEQSPQN